MAEKIYFSSAGLRAFHKETERLSDEAKSKTQGEFEGAAGVESSVWHDNFEHEEAHRKLQQRAKALQERHQIASNAEVVDIQEQTHRVAIGSTIILVYEDKDETREITIGAHGESDPKQGLITYQSPLAQSIMGKKEGDDSIIMTPQGKKQIYIQKLHPASFKYRQLIAEIFKS